MRREATRETNEDQSVMPVVVVITGIVKPEILDQALEAARTFKPLIEAETASLLVRPHEGRRKRRQMRAP